MHLLLMVGGSLRGLGSAVGTGSEIRPAMLGWIAEHSSLGSSGIHRAPGPVRFGFDVACLRSRRRIARSRMVSEGRLQASPRAPRVPFPRTRRVPTGEVCSPRGNHYDPGEAGGYRRAGLPGRKQRAGQGVCEVRPGRPLACLSAGLSV
jgi:hypothetical protein